MPEPSARLDARRRAHAALAARLAGMSDDALVALLAAAEPWRRSWGESATIELHGEKLFVKKISLTDLERAADGSTANLFGLPLFYQYGVGSAGFGAWRELAACTKASAWALAGECANFPLLYHWSVLPRTPPPLTDNVRARLQEQVDYWNGSEAVGARLEAMWNASATITLFLEHAPENLHEWFGRALAQAQPAVLQTAIHRLYGRWRETAAFMYERGMLHFDAHTHNVQTDGEQIYVADFGLALCADFELAPAERSFFDAHRLYDRCYVEGSFVDWLTAQPGSPALPPGVGALVDRCRPVADIMRTFLGALRDAGKATPYPAAELEAAFAAQLAAGQGGAG